MNILDKKLEHFTMVELINLAYGINSIFVKPLLILKGTEREPKFNIVEMVGVLAIVQLEEELIREIDSRLPDHPEYEEFLLRPV